MTNKQYNYLDDFELLMIRHDYINKIKNPDPNWIKKFESTVNVVSFIMYNKLKPNFDKVGYDLDDIKILANCYMIGYMGLYSIERNEDIKQRILNSFAQRHNRQATQADLDKKERINLTTFLRQRLQHASILCARKARNITVGSDRRGIYAFTKDSIPATEELILEKGMELGYRSVTRQEFKELKAIAKSNKLPEIIDHDGFKVLEIEILNDGISAYDYKFLFYYSDDDVYTVDPESLFISKEGDRELSYIKEKFYGLSREQKRRYLYKFLKEFKSDPHYKQELKAARYMLKTI